MAEKDISNNAAKKIAESGDISNPRLAAEINRIWSTFEDVGSAYNDVEDNVHRMAQARPHETRERLNDLKKEFEAFVETTQNQQRGLEQNNLALTKRLLQAERDNTRLTRRLDKLEILVAQLAPQRDHLSRQDKATPDGDQESDSSPKRVSGLRRGRYKILDDSEDAEDSPEESPRKRTKTRRRSTAGKSSVPAIEDDLTDMVLLDGEDLVSPYRRTSRPRKPVQKKDFETWKGKRLSKY